MTRTLLIQMYTILTVIKPTDDTNAEKIFTAGSPGKGSTWSIYRELCFLQIATGICRQASHETGMHPNNLRCMDKIIDNKEYPKS
jgi:hypothetical protein